MSGYKKDACTHTMTYGSVIGRYCWLSIFFYGWLLILVHDFMGRKTEYVVRKYKTSCMKDLADLATLTPACVFFCVLISALSLKSIAPKFGVLSTFSPPLNCNFRGIPPTIPGLCLVSYRKLFRCYAFRLERLFPALFA